MAESQDDYVEAEQLTPKSGGDDVEVFVVDPLDNAVDHDTTNQRADHGAIDLAAGIVDYLEEQEPDPPTGVTPGAPGTWTPADAAVPADLAALNALGALGQTAAWAGGTFMTLGDGSSAYWDGTTWVAGTAPVADEDDEEPASQQTKAKPMKAAKSTRRRSE